MAHESWEDIIIDIFKFAVICGLILGGIWLVTFYIIEQNYTKIEDEINSITNDLEITAESFGDAVQLLDYDNAFETYQGYKVLCERLRLKYNNAPDKLKNRDFVYFDSIRKTVKTCQGALEPYSKTLTTLRLTHPLLG